VPVPGQGQVGPDLVGDHPDPVLLEDLHGGLDLPALPDPAAGVVGAAKDVPAKLGAFFHPNLFLGKHPFPYQITSHALYLHMSISSLSRISDFLFS
jgi:hypothetical protein